MAVVNFCSFFHEIGIMSLVTEFEVLNLGRTCNNLFIFTNDCDSSEARQVLIKATQALIGWLYDHAQYTSFRLTRKFAFLTPTSINVSSVDYIDK